MLRAAASAPFLRVVAICALVLTGCGPAADAPAGAPEDAAAQANNDRAIMEAQFAANCAAFQMGPAVCACVADHVENAAGLRGLGYIAAAFSDDPSLAEPFEAAMTQDERNDAAVAYLDGQFECVAAADPDFAPPDPGAAGPAELPLEQAVALCMDAGAGEPECRCRVETALDGLGEDGLRLAAADAAGDTGAVRALAQERGGDWLDSARAALEQAALQCR